MKPIYAIALAALVGVWSWTAVAEQPSPLASISDADRFCDGLATTTKDKARRRLFSTIRKEGKKPVPWQEFAGDRELRARLRSADEYEVAQFWKRDDGAATALITSTSDTGDWSHVVAYCFRTDGGLARTEFIFRSSVLWGGISGVRKRYFDAAGKQIGSSSEVRNLETNRILPKREYPEQEPVYARLADLPFASLLR